MKLLPGSDDTRPAQKGQTLRKMTPPDDGSWALTPQDHAVLQVHHTLQQERRGQKQAAWFLGALTAAAPWVGVFDPDSTWLEGALAGGALAVVSAAVLLAGRKQLAVMVDCVNDNGVDVKRWHQVLSHRVRATHRSVRLMWAMGAVSAAAMVVDAPVGACMAVLTVMMGVTVNQLVRKKLQAQLQQLGPGDNG